MRIDSTNYDDFLIRKLEGLLNRDEAAELDSFMLRHPELHAEWLALEQTVLVADEKIVFADKASLKRHERKIVPLYSKLAVAISIAATLLFVIYIGAFRFTTKNTPATIASNRPSTSTSPVTNNEAQVQANPSTPPAHQLIAQAVRVNSAHVGTYHYVQYSQPVSQILTTSSKEETQSTPSSSVPVEMVSMNPSPVKAIPYRMKISLAPYKTVSPGVEPNATDNLQPARTTEHASLVQFASVLGTELYHLSGRGELPVNRQQIPDHNDVSISVKTRLFDAFKKIHSHTNKKTI